MNKLIVRNERVLSEYFHVQLEVLNESYDQFKSFTKETGLSILRVYHVQNSYNEYYLDERGIVSIFENDYGIPNDRYYIFKHHLTVHVYLDKIMNENNCIYGLINGQKQLIYQENVKYNKTKYNGRDIRILLSQNDLSQKDIIEKTYMLLPKQTLPPIKIEEIKQIVCVYPFEDILILKNNGELFVNGRLYAKNVRELNCLTSYRTYIIFENENVEFYTSAFMLSASIIVKAVKTLTVNNSFITILTDERDLFISTIGSDNCADDFDFDNCVEFYLSDIDDFTYTYDLDSNVATLNVIVGDKKILFPLYINMRK